MGQKRPARAAQHSLPARFSKRSRCANLAEEGSKCRHPRSGSQFCGIMYHLQEGRDYLSIKLDDPSFTAPIFASLFADEDGKTFNLIWSRARTSNSH